MDELGILYYYLPTELEPPNEVWHRLVKVLDDAKPNAFEKIDGLEITPPIFAWENIVSALYKLDTPENNPLFADKFSALEIVPPTFVWEKIETCLDTNQPIRKIGGRSNTTKKILTGLAIAACIISIIFSSIENFDIHSIKQSNTQVAIANKSDNPIQHYSSSKAINDSHKKQAVVANQTITRSFTGAQTPAFNNAEIEERELKLEKYKPGTVANINTTNNQVATKTGKLRDAFGNVIDKISDYTTGGNYVAAIGPNGNLVNVSTKLTSMIEFFQEDTAVVKNEEYLDKVMRESNIWHQKLIDWRKKVDAADANPSQMNFLNVIDLIDFFKKNK